MTVSEGALPALSEPLPAYPIQPLPTDRPAVYSYTPWPNPRPACRHCTLHRAIGPNPSTALVRPEDHHAPLLCNRHRRWLGTCSDTTQYDLSHTHEIITAAHRYQELLTGHPDPEWAIENLQAAWRITQNWAQHPPNRLSKTAKRWRARAEALGIPGALQQPVVSYPEAVTLTGVLIDLTWRRHVAMVEEWELARFYQAITHRLGEPGQDRQPGSRLLWGQRDALTRWVDTHRCRFSAVRRRYQAEQQRHWFAIPLPEKGHFK